MYFITKHFVWGLQYCDQLPRSKKSCDDVDECKSVCRCPKGKVMCVSAKNSRRSHATCQGKIYVVENLFIWSISFEWDSVKTYLVQNSQKHISFEKNVMIVTPKECGH